MTKKATNKTCFILLFLFILLTGLTCMYSYYIYICLSKHENDLVLMILRCYYYLKYNRLILNRKRFLYEYNNNFKQKRVNAYALKKKEKRARSL